MTPDEILASLFPGGHGVTRDGALLLGYGPVVGGGPDAAVVGVTDGAVLGVDEALRLSGYLLDALMRACGPVLVIVDSGSQRMSRRDELLGLSEFLAHLAKVLLHADRQGHPTVGLLTGGSAAGAFIATALATRSLVALPGAHPAVMDLPSMARITKLPVEVLEDKARSTPVFAPGLDNLARTGAVLRSWDPGRSLADQLGQLLAETRDTVDDRDRLGRDRAGRPKAADIAARVEALALGRG